MSPRWRPRVVANSAKRDAQRDLEHRILSSAITTPSRQHHHPMEPHRLRVLWSCTQYGFTPAPRRCSERAPRSPRFNMHEDDVPFRSASPCGGFAARASCVAMDDAGDAGIGGEPQPVRLELTARTLFSLAAGWQETSHGARRWLRPARRLTAMTITSLHKLDAR